MEQISMSKAKIVNVTTHVIGIDRAQKAEQLADQPDPGASYTDTSL